MADVMFEFHDGPHATPPPSEAGPIYLGIKNLTENGSLDLTRVRHIAEEDFPRWTKRVTPQPGDLVFTYEATLHRYALIPKGFRGCLGRRLALIRPRLDVIDSNFLLLLMLGPEWRRDVEAHVITGATVDRIPLIDFPSFRVRLPELATQRRIAGFLTAFDELSRIHERRIELLEAHVRGLYREWFLHRRWPGHRGEESESGNGLPAGWESCSLGDVARLHYGKSLPKQKRHGGDVPVVSSAGVVDSHDAALTAGPGVVIGRKGNVGSVWWIDDPFFPIDTTYYVESDLPLGFLYWVLRDADFIDSHAAVPGLSRDQALAVEVVVPPEELVERFARIHETTFRGIAVCREMIRRLTATRDLLLPRLISGEVDISGLDLGALTPVEPA